MKIVTIEELRKMPIGTVFCELDKYGNLVRDYRIIACKYAEDSFGAELALYPYICSEDRFYMTEKSEIHCEWETEDTASFEYDKEQRFAVFNKEEVKEMIRCLQWALNGCKEV